MATRGLTDYEAAIYAHRDLSLDDFMQLPQFKDKNPMSMDRQRRMAKRIAEANGTPDTPPVPVADRLGKIADLLQRSGIDVDDVGRVEKIRLNEWQGFYKDAHDEAQTVDLEAASLILTPKWAEGPAWPVVQPCPPMTVRSLPHRKTAAHTDMEVAVILPDAQIGFYRDQQGQLHPTHDEAALDVAMQVLRAANPDRVILLGDNLDFPELGKYRKEPAFAMTTQPTIDRAALFIATIRANIRPDASIDWLEGNHDIRLSNYIKDNAAAAFGLRPGNLPRSWPVLSVPTLCRLDEMNATFVPGYPANEVWLSDRLHAIHGYRAQKSSNAYPYLNEERCSTIYAHTHRREWAERTRESRYGPRTIMAASPGCLCRIDGSVPSAKGGTDLDGIPLVKFEDWQQGLAVVTFTPGDGPFFYEPVPIHHGGSYFHGTRFNATCDVEGRSLEEVA